MTRSVINVFAGLSLLLLAVTSKSSFAASARSAAPRTEVSSGAEPKSTSSDKAAAEPHVLYLQQGKQWRLVCDVEREQPFILIDGHREPADSSLRDVVDPTLATAQGNGYSLKPVELFYPALITIDHLASQIKHQQVDRIQKLEQSLTLRASFEPSTFLQRVFLAIQVTAKSGNQRFYLHELGNLEPGKPKYLSVDHVFGLGFEPASFRLYVFSQGVEVLHTEMSAAELNGALDKIVEYQVKKDPHPAPRALISPPATYPEELREKKLSGSAVVSLRVATNGQVQDPHITSASDPAFGEAALKSLARWRFIPAVKDGKAVASAVSLPFSFSP